MAQAQSLFVQVEAKNTVSQYVYRGDIYDLREVTEDDLQDIQRAYRNSLRGWIVGFKSLTVVQAENLGLI
jgi:hypothetical protein